MPIKALIILKGGCRQKGRIFIPVKVINGKNTLAVVENAEGARYFVIVEKMFQAVIYLHIVG